MPRLAWVLFPLALVRLSALPLAPAELVEISPVVIVRTGGSVPQGAPILRYECNAVALDRNTVATAAHCLADNVDRLSVASGGSNICEDNWHYTTDLEVLYKDKQADLALVRTGHNLAVRPTTAIEVSPGAVIAVGWQRASRTGPLTCGLSVAELAPVGCDEPPVNGQECFRNIDASAAVCAGLSGAPIIHHQRAVAVVAASDGCSNGALVEAAAIQEQLLVSLE